MNSLKFSIFWELALPCPPTWDCYDTSWSNSLDKVCSIQEGFCITHKLPQFQTPFETKPRCLWHISGDDGRTCLLTREKRWWKQLCCGWSPHQIAAQDEGASAEWGKGKAHTLTPAPPAPLGDSPLATQTPQHLWQLNTETDGVCLAAEAWKTGNPKQHT